MLSLNHYVINPQPASQNLECYLLVGNLCFCRGMRDGEYYTYDVMLGTLQKQIPYRCDDKYNILDNFWLAWYWVPGTIRIKVNQWMLKCCDREPDWDNRFGNAWQVIEKGREKLIACLRDSTAPKVGGDIARIFNALANRRVSGDELVKGLKALNVDLMTKVQASYLGGWNIEGYTIESLLRKCAGQPDE